MTSDAIHNGQKGIIAIFIIYKRQFYICSFFFIVIYTYVLLLNKETVDQDYICKILDRMIDTGVYPHLAVGGRHKKYLFKLKKKTLSYEAFKF